MLTDRDKGGIKVAYAHVTLKVSQLQTTPAYGCHALADRLSPPTVAWAHSNYATPQATFHCCISLSQIGYSWSAAKLAVKV